MRKDTLTLERIKDDYIKQLAASQKSVVATLVILVLIPTLFVAFFIFLEASSFFMFLLLLVCFPLFLYIYIHIVILVENYKHLKAIKSGSFKIVTDKLVSTHEEERYVGSAFLASFSRPYKLSFASYGDYVIQDNNYSSSKLYNMNAKGVFNYSHNDDVFYLVIDNKEKILAAYNTELFELIDEEKSTC